MAAAAPAAPTAAQMVLRRKDEALTFHVEVTGHWRKLRQRTDPSDQLLPFEFRMCGDRFEASAAETALLRHFLQDPPETGIGQRHLLAPARPFVQFARFQPTAVGRATHDAVAWLEGSEAVSR